MSIVPSKKENEQEISNTISRIIRDFRFGSLLKKYNCKKEKGIPFASYLNVRIRARSQHP